MNETLKVGGIREINRKK